MSDPATTAARYLASKKVVATVLSSREISEHIPRALRDNAVFSARTLYAEHLAETQAEITRLLDGRAGPAEIRTRMKMRLEALGYSPAPGEEGSLTDLSSDMRTNLIIAMQEAEARGYAVWRSQQDEAVLTVWPAQELYRAQFRQKPRDWRTRWNEARADLGEGNTSATYAVSASGPFVALRGDRIWRHPAVNRFGRPWPPFDYNSGMRLRGVKASQAREKNVLKGRAFPKPARDPMDGSVRSSSAAGMDAEIVRAWAAAFGARARVYKGRGGIPRVAVAPDAGAARQVIDGALSGGDATAAFGFPTAGALEEIGAAIGKPVRPETPLQVSAADVRHILKAHGAETRTGQHPVTTEDIKRVPEIVAGPGRWRASTPQEKGSYEGDAVTFAADTGERISFRVTAGKNDPRITLKTMWIEKQKDRPAD